MLLSPELCPPRLVVRLSVRGAVGGIAPGVVGLALLMLAAVAPVANAQSEPWGGSVRSSIYTQPVAPGQGMAPNRGALPGRPALATAEPFGQGSVVQATALSPAAGAAATAADANPTAGQGGAASLAPTGSEGGTLPLKGAGVPLPLSPPGDASGSTTGNGPAVGSIVTVGGSLALVLGIFFVFAWSMRRAAPKSALALPGEVVEVLGRAPLGARQHVHLLRVGSKLLLVSVTAAGAETLTEIADPIEVDRLAGLCRQSQPGSVSATFRQALQQFTSKRVGRDALDDTAALSPMTTGPLGRVTRGQEGGRDGY